MHRDFFAAAVKYAKEEKTQHIFKHGNMGRKESQAIYYKAIQDFMKAVKKAKQPETKYDISWENKSIQFVTKELIKMATTLVTGGNTVKKEVIKGKPGVKKG